MKKIILLVVVCFMVTVILLAIGCKIEAVEEATEAIEEAVEDTAPTEEAAEEEITVEQEPLKIVFANAFYSAPYCAPQISSAEETAVELGVDLQVLDGKADGQVQLDQIENAILQGVDGILYFPADQESSATAVRRLAESEVPFIIINSRADPSVDDLVPVFLGPDYYTQGQVAGQMALDALGEEGGNIVAIEGAGGTEAQKKRGDGFYETVLTNPNNQILAKQIADWDPAKAQVVMEDYIVKFGDQMDLLYAMDDGMWAGAIKAIKDAGMLDQILSVSIGSNKAVVEGVRNGECYGSASQSPADEGRMGIEYIIKLINGETLEKWIKIPSDPITSETVADIQGW